MLIHPNDEDLVLIDASDLELPPVLRGYEPQLQAIFDWGRDYLCQPHPDLGREGNVCPFAQSSMDRERFYLSVYPGKPDDAEEVATALKCYRDWFLDLAPREMPGSQITAIMILFPDLPDADVVRIIDQTQNLLKSDYVTGGLMIGEFHGGPPRKGGLRNPDFLPLHSPVPMLAIRHMVPTDFPFLRDDPEQVRAYLNLFADMVPAPLRESVRAAKAELGLA